MRECFSSPEATASCVSPNPTQFRGNNALEVLTESEIEESEQKMLVREKHLKKRRSSKRKKCDEYKQMDKSKNDDMSQSSVMSSTLTAMANDGIARKKVIIGDSTLMIQQISTVATTEKETENKNVAFKVLESNTKRKGTYNHARRCNSENIGIDACPSSHFALVNSNVHLANNNVCHEIGQKHAVTLPPSLAVMEQYPLAPTVPPSLTIPIIDNPTHNVAITRTKINVAKTSSENQKNLAISLRELSTYIFKKELSAEVEHKHQVRKWYSPTRCLDFCMHRTAIGRLLIMLLSWTPVVDYCKDFYVMFHLLMLQRVKYFVLSSIILFLSLRLFLFLRATDDDKVSLWKLFLFYIPGRFGSIRDSIARLILLYVKSLSLFHGTANFENPYLLVYTVVECIFETIPQLILQTYIYWTHRMDKEGAIDKPVIYFAWAIMGIVLVKILIIIWWNWRIIYRLSFKRRHNAEVTSVHNHPYLDLIASGSCDYTVLVYDVVDRELVKTKRVLDHNFYVHCVRWSPDGNLLAVAGQGIDIWDWREGKKVHHFPKNYTRDLLRRKKRLRRKEVKDCVWDPNGRYLLFCIGKSLTIYDIKQAIEVTRVKAQQGNYSNALNDIQCVCISPSMKYAAIGIFHSQINVFKLNLQNSKKSKQYAC
ncbi:hypothetical protein RFI_15950 [Reticulomyxa filosa]|uniref:Anaphase-promoting complex subunit 4-like WD40 domain-containing protein n=1 Tax=Reticulomyxa filosa TaxID=46433 RepID=X6N665_RETFI|nr:hypothetical protein RFI_15950 [Reticulomyxa filosa]|eukprot:ETO21254.1 hypothetical protein RFI_15950 [Reticulomyxa filosa]